MNTSINTRLERRKRRNNELAKLTFWSYWKTDKETDCDWKTPTKNSRPLRKRRLEASLPTAAEDEEERTWSSDSEAVPTSTSSKKDSATDEPESSAAKRRKSAMEPTNFHWSRRGFIQTIVPAEFYWPDPFCDFTLGMYLALCYLGDRRTSFDAYLVENTTVVCNLQIDSKFVDYFRTRYTQLQPTSAEDYTATWCFIDPASAAQVLDIVCSAYGVSSPNLERMSFEDLQYEKRSAVTKMQSILLDGTTVVPYEIYINDHFYSAIPKIAAMRVLQNDGVIPAVCTRPLGPPYLQYKLSPYPIYYRPAFQSITVPPKFHVRDLLRALYHHLATHNVMGFESNTGQNRSQKWADAYWGIVQRIMRSEEAEAGRSDWPTIASLLDHTTESEN